MIKFFVCGILTSFLFPPFFLIPIGFVVFPFLFKLLIDKEYINSNFKTHFLAGLFYGLGFFTIYLGWIKEPFFIEDETKKYAFISYLLIIYCSLYFGLIFIILKYLNNNFIKFLSLPLLIVISEYICANFIYGFPWFSFSLINANNIFGTSIIFYFGTYGLSFLTITIFLFPVIIFSIRKKSSKILLTFYLILFFIIFSIILIRFFQREAEPQSRLDISIVQLNFPINQYISDNKAKTKYDEILDIIKNNNSKIIVFGENDFPFLMDKENINSIQKNIKNDQYVVIGSTRSENKKFYNSIFFIDNKEYKVFDKKILVPFGEFVPLRTLFRFMNSIAGTVDFTRGNKERDIKLDEKLKIIPVICYEIIFFWKLINKQNFNADIILNLTNDSWFGEFSGPYQHFYFTKLRAAEFNKPVIRISNNGVSGYINNFGEVINSIPLNKKKVLTFDILINDNKNNFIFIHNLINVFIILFFLTLLFLNKKYEA